MKCLHCKKEIVKSGRKGRGKNFCSRECFNLGSTIKTFKKGNKINLGRKLPPRSKEYIKKSSDGHKGIKPTIATRKKQSDSHKGEKCHFWKGGITLEHLKIRTSIEMRLWRESVFARDNFTDQKTGIRGGDLHAHHILNFAEYPELRFAIDNGITLSKESHKEFHKKYGMRNNTREQLLEFLTL